MDYTEKALAFLALTEEREELEARLAKVKARLSHLEEGLLEDFAAVGRQRDTINGRTLYLRRDTYASVPKQADGWDHANAVLRKHGLAFMVKTAPVPATVRAWIIEQEKEAREMGKEFTLAPKELADIIRIEHRFSIRATAPR